MPNASPARIAPVTRSRLRFLLLGGSAICGAAAVVAPAALAVTLPTQLTVDLAKSTGTGSGTLAGQILNAAAATPTTLTYASTGSAATVALAAPRTLIDWSTFTVGSGATLNFTFAGAASDVVLNRVMSGAITVESGGAVNATFAGKTGGNVWFLAPGGVFIHGTVTASGVLATNNTKVADFDLLNTDIAALKTELSAAGSLIDLSGIATATGAEIDASGNIVLSGAVSASGDVMLQSTGTLAVNAPVTALGATPVTLAYDASAPANLSFGAGGSVSFARADGGAATSSQGGSLKINGQAYTLLYNLAEAGSTGPDSGAADIAGIDANTAAGGDAGLYALATDLTGAGTAAKAQFGGALAGAGTNVFNGVLEGLGHSITNLTINDATPSENLGLLGSSTGVVRDIALVGGSVTGAALNYVGGTALDLPLTGAVGSLVGYNGAGGRVVGATSSAAVNTIPDADTYGAVGGLVGFNDKSGAVLDASASGAVYGGNEVGGLVGRNRGAVTNAFATGAVYGGDQSSVGGLVGNNGGPISQAYATGAVTDSGTSGAGGLIGLNVSNSNYVGSVSAVAFDTATSGQTVGVGQDNNAQDGAVAALTTGQLQGTLPSGFDKAIWSTGAGLYPYLTAALPNGVQAVSGYAYGDAGTTALASGVGGAVTVGVIGGGASLGAATTGANGYYYVATPTGSVVSGASLLAYVSGGRAATLASATGATAQTGVNLYGGAVTMPTSATQLSTAPTLAQAQTAALAADGGVADAAAAVNAATGLGLIASGASFTVDTAVTTGSTLYIQTASGAPLTVSQPITVASGGSLGLVSGGTLAINSDVTAEGAVSVNLGYDASDPTNLHFGANDALTYANADGGAATASAGGALQVNGAAYALLYRLTDSAAPTGNRTDTGVDDIAGIDAAGASGDYALAVNVAGTGAVSAPQFSGALAGAASGGFTGVFEGLGHTVANLTLADSGDRLVGLFGAVGVGGVVRDTALVGGSVSLTLTSPTLASGAVGALVGQNSGTLAYDSASAAVAGTGTSAAPTGGVVRTGGLVGLNSGGDILGSSASGMVSGVGVAGQGVRVGGLAGQNTDGSISDSFATGAVSGVGDTNAFVDDSTNGYVRVGGLVGTNLGPIRGSYATGAVTGSAADIRVGGLAGTNSPSGDDGAPTPSIDGSFASGAVSATTFVNGLAAAGGLVANNSGPVTNSAASGAVSVMGGTGATIQAGGLIGYNGPASGSTVAASVDGVLATGAVSASVGTLTSTGGVIGVNDAGGTVANAAYDTLTTGQASGIGLDSNGQSAGVAGLTTLQLQTGGLPAGFDTAVWGGGTGGLYPYLKAFDPNGVQAISGVAYADAGKTVLASGLSGAVAVTLTVDGAPQGVASTGANGYYYAVVPVGVIDTVKGSTVLTTVAANAATGAANAAGLAVATGTTAGVDLYGGDLLFTTPAVTASASGFSGALSRARGYATTPSFVADLPLFIRATGSGFTVDQALSYAQDLEVQTTAAAAPLTLGAPVTLSGSHSLTLAGTGDVSLGADIGAGAVALTAGGAVSQTAGIITAATVGGASAGGFSLADANKIAALSGVTNTGAGDIVVASAQDLTVSAISNSAGSIDLSSTGALSQNGGAIGASQDVTLSAGTTLDLQSAPVVSRDYAVTALTFSGQALNPTFSAGRDFTVHALGDLTLAAPLTAPHSLSVSADGALDTTAAAATAIAGSLTLSGGNGLSVGATTATAGGSAFSTTAGAIALTGVVDAGAETLTLSSAGAISQTGSIIIAGDVAGGSKGGASLTGANLVDRFGAFANTGAGAVSLTDAQATGLTVSGAVDAGAGNTLTLTTTTGGLTLAANVTAAGGTVTLSSAGGLAQTAGVITTATLTGSSVGGASLTDANRFDSLAAFTNVGAGTVSLVDAKASGLTVTSAVDAGPGNAFTLTTTNGGSLTLSADLSAAGGTVDLVSAGALSQTAGAIDTAHLTGSSAGGAALTGANRFDTLGPFANVGLGDVSITDAKASGLTVTGAIDAGGGNSLTLNATTGSLTLSADLTAAGGAVILDSAGVILQTAGVITTGSLSGASVGGAGLGDANLFDSVGGFANTGGGDVTIQDAKATGLTLAFGGGGVSNAGGGNILLGAAGPLSLQADVADAGAMVSLSSGGAISQTAGVITAATLNSASQGDTILAKANQVDTLAGFTNGGAGQLTFVDAKATGLTVSQDVDAGAGNVSIASTAAGVALDLSVNLSTDSSHGVRLSSGGALSQTAGVITTGALSTASTGGASLTGNNSFDTLSGLSNLGVGPVSVVDVKSTGLTVTGAADAGNGNTLTLTTTTGPLTLSAGLTAINGVVDLSSAGAITQTAGVITAARLDSASQGAASLTGANNVATLSGFTNGGAGDLSFTDAAPGGFTVASDINAAAGNLALTSSAAGKALAIGVNLSTDGAHGVTLTSGGTLEQTAGAIVAGSLGGGSVGGADLTQPNAFDTLAAFANSGGGAVSIRDAKTSGLVVTGVVDAGAAGALNLDVAGDLVLSNSLDAAGGAVRLSSAGSIVQTAGAISTGGLTTASSGGVALPGANQFATLAGVSNSGGDVRITDALAAGLTVAGDVTPGGDLALVASGGPLVLSADLVAPGAVVSLQSAGAISQSGSGIIAAGTLDSVSAGPQSLTHGNLVDTLGTFANGGSGTLAFTDAQPTGLVLGADINAGAGDIVLASTAPGVALRIGVNLTTDSSHGVSLASAGAIDQTAGIISGGGLTGSSVGGAVLTDANVIDVVQGFTNTGVGGLSITDAKGSGLTVTSALDAGAGNTLTLTTTNGGALTLSADLTAAGGTVDLVSAGPLSQTAGAIGAATLTGSSVGGASLTDANRFDSLAGFVNSGGDVAILDSKASGLTVTAAVDAGAGDNLTLTTTNGAALTLSADVTAVGGSVDLVSAGALTQSAGVITTAALSGSSVGGASLTDANLFDSLAGFTNTGGGALSIVDAKASGLTVTGAVNAGDGDPLMLTTTGGPMTLSANLAAAGATVSLVSAGPLTQTAGVITTGTLNGSTVGGAILDDANRFDVLAGFANVGVGAVRITDAKPTGLTVTGPVDTGGNDLTLTTAVAGPLTLSADLTATGRTVTLISAGALTQTAGVITAATVTGSSAGGAALTDANLFDTLAGFANGGDHGLAITDARASGLTVTGAVTAGSGASLTLTTANGGSLTLAADLTAAGGTVDLLSTGALIQTAGVITSSAVTGASVGRASLTDANQFDSLAGFVNAGVGSVAITDAKRSGLTVTSAVDGGVGDSLTLTTTQGGALTLAADLTAAGGTVDLVSAGTLTQAKGVIATSTLTGSSVGGARLADADQFDVLDGFTNAGAGAVTILDAKASGLTVTASVDTGGGPLTLTTANGGSLTLAANLTAAGSTVDLASAGALSQTGGVITAATLTGASVGGASLTDANAFDTLAGFVNAAPGGVSIADAKASGLTVTALVDAGAGDSLTLATANGGPLTLSANLTAAGGTVALASAGALAQTAGIITTGALTGSSVGGANLTDANLFDSLSGFVNRGGPVSIVDASAGGLTVTSTLDAGAADALTLTTTQGGALTLAADVRAPGGSVTLVSAGAIDQTAGVLTTATLTGSSVGGASLADANVVGGLASFANRDSGALTLVDAGPLVVAGVVDNTAGAAGGTGRDVAVTVLSGDLSGTGAFTAARDVALSAPQGALSFATATAGDDLVLRAASGVTVTGALTTAGTASGDDGGDPAGAGDILAAAAPFTLYGVTYGDLTDGAHIDVATTAGDLTVGGALSAAGDVRLMAVAGAVHTGDIAGGRSILIAAGLNVDRGLAASDTLTAQADVAVRSDQGDLALGLVTAGGDIVLQAATGSVSLASASAGDDLLVRAGGSATASGALTAGLGGEAAGVADQFLLSQPGQAASLFGHLYAGATGGSALEVIAQSGSVTLGGAVTATGGDIRLQSAQGGVGFTSLSASGSLAVDGAAAVVGQSGVAGGDVAIRGGSISLGSLQAGDDIVLRAGGALSVTGGLAAAGAANVAGPGDDLAAFAPLSPFGGSQKALDGGSSIDIGAASATVGGDVTAAGVGSDVRFVASAGDLRLAGAVSAGGDVALDAQAGGVAVGGAVEAGGDVAAWARAGSLTLVSAAAGDQIVLRAPRGAVTAGGLAAGLGPDPAGAGEDLAAADPLTIFAAADPSLAGGSVNIGAQTVRVSGAVTAGYADATALNATTSGADIRILATGADPQGATGPAIQLLGGAHATGDIALDATAGGVLAAGGALGAGRDVAVWAEAGGLTLVSADAGDDIVLRSRDGVLVSGALAAGGGQQGAGAGDALVAASPMTVFGHTYGDVADGAHLEVATQGGNLSIGGATSAAGDVRLQAQAGDILLGDVHAGRDIVLDANGSVTPSAAAQNAAPQTDSLTAGQDVAAQARTGSIAVDAVSAGGSTVLRAVDGGVTVTGAMASGGAAGAASGAAGFLAKYRPTTLFATTATDGTGAGYPTLNLGDVDVQAQTVNVSGATTAAGAAADVRILATGVDSATMAALRLGGPVQAGRDVDLDAVGGSASATPATTGSITVGLPTAGGSESLLTHGDITASAGTIAIRSLTGGATLTSASAADNVVLVAQQGKVAVNGSITAAGQVTTSVGQTLFDTVKSPLDGLFTLGQQSIFIDAKTYANGGYAATTPATLTATTGVGVLLADSGGLYLADADPKAGSWLDASTILTKTLTLFETKGDLVVGAAKLNTPMTTANLYVDSSAPSATSGSVKVRGLFAPSVDNVVTLNIGTPDSTAAAASWTPSGIEVVNDAGAGPNTGAIGYTAVDAGNVYSTAPRTFFAASLYAKVGILLGTQLFDDTNAGVTSLAGLMQIDPSRPTPTTPANTSKAIMLAAGDLSLSAGTLIVQQNTTGLHTTDGTGYYVTRTLSLTAYGPNPPAIDLFGVFTKPGTTIPITGPAAADVDQVLLPLGSSGTSLAGSPYRALYRINSCVIGELGNCTPTTDAIVTIPLDQLSRGALLSRDELDVEDPTITGAPNEEIWRRPDDRQ